MSDKKFSLWLLAFILLLAFGLRVVAIKPGYTTYHPDEPVVYSLAAEMIKDNSLNPHRFDYPSLSMYLHAFFYRTFFIPLEITKTFFLQTGAYLDNLTNFKDFLWNLVVGTDHRQKVVFWGRTISMLAGTLTVFLTYLLGKKAFGQKVGLVAAFFLAVNYRHLISSILALPNVLNALFTVSAFGSFLLLLEKPTRKRYLLSGVLVGLVVATKYQVMIFLPFGLTHLFVCLREKNFPGILKKLFVPGIFLGVISAVLVFFLFNPYVLINFQEALAWITKETAWYEMGVIALRTAPLFFLYRTVLGKLLSVAAIVGVVIGLLRKRYWPLNFLFLSFLAIFFFVLLVYSHGGIYGRNFTPLVPFILIMGALGLVEIFGRKPFFLFLATVVVALPSLKNSWLTSCYLSKPWNEGCVRLWLLRNLPAGQKVGIVSPSPIETIERVGSEWVFFEPKEDFTLPELQETGVNYLVINLDPFTAEFVGWLGQGSEFWQLPVDVLDNSLAGLVLKQLSRYSVKNCFKPWPVPAYNYIIAKIPKREEPTSPELLKAFSLDEQEGEYPSGWQVVAVRQTEVKGFFWLNEAACLKGGCLKIAAGASSSFRPIRFVSEALPIQPGKKYLVQGWIRTEKSLSDEPRDGFFRIDFYDNEELGGGERGRVAAVSGRGEKEGGWAEKWVETVTPPQARFMRVSLQHQSSSTGFFFDEIKVYQAEATDEEKRLSVQPEVEDLILYPEIVF